MIVWKKPGCALPLASRIWDRARVDVDEAPVDLPPGRAFAQRVDRRAERRVGEDRTVDQHRRIERVRRRLSRQDTAQEGAPAGPCEPPLLQHAVQLADHEGREGARKTGRRSRREGEFRQGCQGGKRPAMVRKADHQAMLGLHHLGRAS